ncbi:nucleotidyltransferase family protein [Desertibaculum subflavum]|uniref:nucleotidyltransferase family protein n=1 Tax=Desertibaculum subflavum TaxID=2268458 RepID=UPI000E665830
MLREDVIARLRAEEAALKRAGVEHLYLFGSVAREQAQPASDVDLYFEHQKGAIGLFDLMDLQERIREILGRPVDLLTKDSLHPMLRPGIEASALRVF